MGLRFVGGERLQKGRGLGGIFRALKGVFSPIIRGIGRTATKALKSNTGKLIASKIKDQAIDSALSLTSNALKGNDMEESLSSELERVRENAAGTLDQIRNTRKRAASKSTASHSKMKRGRGIMSGKSYLTSKPPKKSSSKKGLKHFKTKPKHFTAKPKNKKTVAKHRSIFH